MMSELTKGLLIAAGAVAVTGGIVLVAKHAQATTPAPTPAPAPTPTAALTQWTSGSNYQFASPLPAGVTDPTTLTTQLQANGWSNVTILWPWAPTGTQAAVPPGLAAAMQSQGAAIAQGAYVAQGTYGGATMPVPAGVVSIQIP